MPAFTLVHDIDTDRIWVKVPKTEPFIDDLKESIPYEFRNWNMPNAGGSWRQVQT